ncbi:hypothetical protein Dimus_023338 [Dionaea muscipula]
MTITQEPMLSRLDRLDNLLRHLEENIRGSNRFSKSSCGSTPSSGILTSYGGPVSSSDFSPRTIDDVIVEAEQKGTLIQRVSRLESRVLKVEEEMEAERKKRWVDVEAIAAAASESRLSPDQEKGEGKVVEKSTPRRLKGLRGLVMRSCVGGKGKGKGKEEGYSKQKSGT